jgi:hypothetical protein
MFTLISGVHVHEARSGTEQLVYSATRPARSLASVVAGVPPSVVAIIDRALLFEKTQRWPDARNMQGAVRAVLSSLAPQPPTDPRVVPSMQGSAPRMSGAMRTAAASYPEMSASDSMRDLDPVQLQAQVSLRAAERDQRAKEISAAQPVIADLQTRHAAARQKVADAQARLTAARNERTAMEEWSEWDAVNQWLDSMGAPTCMSGWLRNHSALFHYQDTRRKLGYVTEIHPPREPGKGGRWAPDYWYDFSAKTSE